MSEEVKAEKVETVKVIKKGKSTQEISKNLMLASAIAETVLAVPLIGAIIVVGTGWTVLIATLILNIFSIYYANQEDNAIAPGILGVVAAMLGWIPFVAIVLHAVAAVLNWLGFLASDQPKNV